MQNIFIPRRLTVFFLGCFCLFHTCVQSELVGKSQVSSGLAAVVNDQVITHTDVDQRLRLLNLLMFKHSPETLGEIVMNALIEETLKLGLGSKMNIQVSEKEMEQGLERFIQMTQPHLDKAEFIQLLKNRNIDPETVKRQIKAQLVWQKGIQTHYHTQALVTDREIDQELERILKGLQGTQYDLMEIVLPVDQPQQESKVLLQAKALITQLQRGERFEILAQQFSQSPTAAKGGLKGWVSGSMLDPVLLSKITSMSPGSWSEPIRTKEGVYILLLRSKKEGGRTQKISFRQGIMRTQPGSEAEALNAQLQLREALEDVHTCPAFEKAFYALPGGIVDGVDHADGATLPSALQGLLSKAQLNTPTEPLWIEGGMMTLIVCQREWHKEPLPSRDEVAQSLYVDKVNRLALKTMRDLRHKSWIEIKPSLKRSM